MNIALVYTAKSDELKNCLEQKATEAFGKSATIAEYQDVSVLTDSVKAGHITKEAAARYAGLIMQAVQNGADGILSTCCVMGDAVEPLKPFLDFTGTPLVSIDENFCRAALAQCSRICLLATAQAAAFSVRHTFERSEHLMNTFAAIDTQIVKDTAGLKGTDFYEKIWQTVSSTASSYDGLVLAQPSMAFAADYLRKDSGLKIFTAADEPFMILKEKVLCRR